MGIISLINPICVIRDYYYLFQLLDYDLAILPNHYKKAAFGIIKQKRSKLNLTLKVKLMLLISTIFDFAILLLLFLLNPLFSIIYFFVYRLLPIGVLITFVFFYLILFVYEKVLIRKTRKYVDSLNPNLKVIAITGSYGKTTTKNIIYQILSKYRKTQVVGGNINTTLGIINWVRKNLRNNVEYLIVEMGAYRRGEIKKSCSVLKPYVSVITSIGYQHLERYKSIENIVKAKSEILVGDKNYVTDKVFTLLKKGNLDPIIVSSKDGFIETNKEIARRVLLDLSIDENYVESDMKSVELPDRRKNFITYNGYKVLDDSYNINLDSVKASLEIVDGYKNRLCIVAGIPEAGPKKVEFNKELGKLLSSLDRVFVLKTEFSDIIKDGFGKNNNYEIVEDLEEAWLEIEQKYNKEDTVIILFPEGSDLYY